MFDFLRISPIAQFIETAKFLASTDVKGWNVEFGMILEFSEQCPVMERSKKFVKRLSDGIDQEFVDRFSASEERQLRKTRDEHDIY